MGNSTLDPENLTNEPDRRVDLGHGIDALGPSDSSDSGSDIQGGSGLAHEEKEGLDLGSGTTSDLEQGSAGGTAGPDVGDANLDSDSDSGGTGERAAAGRDTTVEAGRDIDVDRIGTVDPAGEDLFDEGADADNLFKE